MFNRNIKLYTATSRNSTNWVNNSTTWEAFCGRFREPVRSGETLAEFARLPKSRQTELKDAGGFVGGEFAGPNRGKSSVVGRDLITLDMDNAQPGETEVILKKIENAGIAAVVYSTRNHRSDRPRLRASFCLKDTIAPDMYEPLARLLADKIGIMANCDPTTFQVSRMMFYPTVCLDGEYVFRVYDSPFYDGLAMLQTFNWKDTSTWKTLPTETVILDKSAKQQQDPTTKTGVVGAFCRTYDIDTAIAEYLPTTYTKAGEHRYTYVAGSTFGGAVTYRDGLFLYSHHATDPCCDRLVNAFDLVRIHLYGNLDVNAKEDTPEQKMPSYRAFVDALRLDPKIQAQVVAEQNANINTAFDQDTEEWAPSAEDLAQMDTDKNGNLKHTIFNFKYILSNDPRLKGHIAVDEFASQMVVKDGIFWDKGATKTRNWLDSDDAQLALFFEKGYGMRHKENLLQALAVTAEANKFNPVKNYLDSLVWDGMNRIDDLLHVYLGAEKNEYTRQVMRCALVGAVDRAVVGGTKWDYSPILVGAQGIGKSTFLAMLGREWFSDSLQSFDGKDAVELIQGIWINEIPELAAFNKSETNRIKQFLTKTDDIYRPAYGRRTEKRPRRCIFFGTTNDDEFLRDPTGNRRYWPVKLDVNRAELHISHFTKEVVDQVWAEAYQLWRNKTVEPYLTGEALEYAYEAQTEYKVADEWEGIVEDYLERDVPDNWPTLGLVERNMVLSGQKKDSECSSKIQKVSIAEIWCEAFGRELTSLSRTDRFRIGAIMRNMPGWEKTGAMRTAYCGVQKGYRRA